MVVYTDSNLGSCELILLVAQDKRLVM